MPDAPKTSENAPPPAKKGKLKLMLVVGGIMAAEAAGVYFLVGMSGGGTQHAAAEIHGAEHAELQQLIEIDVADDKFQNMQTGRAWIWDIQIVLKVKVKNEAFVTGELEKRSAEIREGIAQIMRRAQHAHLREPELTTLNRQLTAYFDKVFGPDPDGHSRLERVLLPKCKGYQMEQ
jgi:flagellar basal body-associated protein FliL